MADVFHKLKTTNGAAESPAHRHNRFRRANGGSRPETLPFAADEDSAARLSRLEQVLQSESFQPDRVIDVFEMLMASRLGARHAVCAGDWAAALGLALWAVGVRPGGRVVTSSYCPFAQVAAICRLGAVPVFADIDGGSLQISREGLEAALAEPADAIVFQHLGGSPTGLDIVAAAAKEREIPLIETAWGLYPPRWGQLCVGQVGAAACLNFAAESRPNGLRGAVLCTDDGELAEVFRECVGRCGAVPTASATVGRKRSNKDSAVSVVSPDSWSFLEETTDAAFVCSELSPQRLATLAALVQLDEDDAAWRRRQQIALTYSAAFSGFAELEPPLDAADGIHAWYLYPLRINRSRLPLPRKEFVQQLAERKIACGVHYIPAHTHPQLRRLWPGDRDPCPNALREFQREISLPIHSEMTDEDAAAVIEAVVDIVLRSKL